MHDIDVEITTLASRQHGVITLADLSRLGVTRAFRRHRVDTGRWLFLYDGVYTLAGHPLSWHGRLLATCHAGGPLARASHRAGAALWRFPGIVDPPIEITCPRWRRHHTSDLVIHETTATDPDGREVAGIPVTSPERTLLDLGAVCSPTVVEMGIDFALRTRLTTASGLAQLLDEVGRQGRNGTGVLRTILEERGDQKPTESPQETRLVRVLRRHGFTGFVPQCEIRQHGRFVARVDIAFPDAKVAVEFDSFRHHTGREALIRDSARRNALMLMGWTVITVTAADFADFSTVSALLRAALATSRSAKT
ncbi:MAG: type IV toxin-antitoxin system AbiEi family antitoxin domain-containing protein [Acidimicrobiia bacterium]